MDNDGTYPRLQTDFSALTLLAAVDVVGRCWLARRMRLRGTDPSSQEPGATALLRSHQLVKVATDLCLQIRLAGLIVEDESDPAPLDAHTFEMLLAARRLAESMRTLHQSLLSLYPDVSAECVEGVRVSIDRAANLTPSGDANEVDLSDPLSELESAMSSVRSELAGIVGGCGPERVN